MSIVDTQPPGTTTPLHALWCALPDPHSTTECASPIAAVGPLRVWASRTGEAVVIVIDIDGVPAGLIPPVSVRDAASFADAIASVTQICGDDR